MGQSKTEYARRRRIWHQPRMFVMISPDTGLVTVHKGACIGDVIFEHETGTYNVSLLYEIARAHPRQCGPFPFPMQTDLLAGIIANPDADKRYAAKIPLETALAEPLLNVLIGAERKTLMVDGQHRCFRMALAGITRYRAYEVPPSLQPPLVTREERHVSECPAEWFTKGKFIPRAEIDSGIAELAAERRMTAEQFLKWKE